MAGFYYFAQCLACMGHMSLIINDLLACYFVIVISVVGAVITVLGQFDLADV